MYNESKDPEYPTSNSGTAKTEVRVFVSHGYKEFQQLRSMSADRVDVTVAISNLSGLGDAKQALLNLADELCEKHPAISVNERVLGGMPHIKGLRISVPHILAHLYHLGSVDAIVADFKQRVSAEQVKQALAYAHDFMEMACDPSEDDD